MYAPDYVVNNGGALAAPGMEVLGWSYSQAETEVIENIQRALSQIFNMSTTNDITGEAAARSIAEERLQHQIQSLYHPLKHNDSLEARQIKTHMKSFSQKDFLLCPMPYPK